MTTATSQPASLGALGRSALMLMSAAVVVQLIGFARQMFLAAQLGLSSGLDAFLISLAAPLAIVGVLTAGVRVALVPAYIDAVAERGLLDGRRLVGAALLWVGLAALVISVLVWVFAEPIVALIGPGLGEAGTKEDAVGYLRQLSPLVLLTASTSILLAQCQAESLFAAMSLSQVANPLLALGVMLFFWGSMGLDGLVMGTLIGAMASLLIAALATVLRRVAPLPRFRLRHAGVPGLVRHATPLTLSAAILEVNLVFDRAIASLFTGGVSALRFGGSLVQVPFAAIRPAWSTVVYPALVQANRGPDDNGLASMTERVTRYAIVFFVPLAGLTIAVAPAATGAAFGRGAFDAEDLTLTAAVVAVSAPLIVTWTVAPMMVSALNALRKGTLMLAASVFNIVLNVALTLILGLLFGVVGVAIATTVVSVVMVLFFGLSLARAEPSFSLAPLGWTFVKASLAILPSTLIFGVVIWSGLVPADLLARLVALVIAGIGGLSSYYVLASRLGLREAAGIVAFGRNTAKRVLLRVRPGS